MQINFIKAKQEKNDNRADHEATSSCKTYHKKRTEIERLNGRIDRDYMFNDHFIRGQKKMDMMLKISFIVMLTMAKGHIKNKQKNIRSLVA